MDYVRKVLHVQPAGGDVGCHQQLQVLTAELVHYELTLRLGEIAVQCFGVVTVGAQLVGDFLSRCFGPAEYNSVHIRMKIHQPFQCRVFLVSPDQKISVVHTFGGCVSPPHGHGLRVVHIVFGDSGDFLRHGGRKQYGAPLRRGCFQNCIQLFFEAHVQHDVRFIQYHVLEHTEVGFALVNEVEQAAGGGYQDMQSSFEGADLFAVPGSAVHYVYCYFGQIGRVGLQLFGYLDGQFPGRAEHQGAGLPRVVPQFFQQGQSESGGLTGSGLC